MIDHVISSKMQPDQGYWSALGILRMSRAAGAARLELACARTLNIRSPHYQTITTMPKQCMEAATCGESAATE